MRRSQRVLAWLVVLLLAVPIWPGAAATGGAQSNEAVWHLVDVRAYYNPPPAENVEVSGLAADGYGGQALLHLDGRAINLCAGGSEDLLVKWRFDRSVAQLRAGDRFSMVLTGVPGARRPPCGGGLIGRTFINSAVPGGHSVGWWTDAERRTTYEGVQHISNERAWGPDWTATPRFKVNEVYPSEFDGTGTPNPQRYTWFSIWLQNPAKDVEIVYFYEIVRGGSPPQPPTGSTATLGGLDLRGYCRAIGADDVGLYGGDWYCGFVDDFIGIDMNAACQWQYNRPDAYAKQRVPGDPQTWVCYAPASGISPPTSALASGPTGSTLPPAATPPGRCSRWNVNGPWSFSQTNATGTFNFEQTGGTLTGTARISYATGTIEGTVDGERIDFVVTWRDASNKQWQGRYDGAITQGAITGESYDLANPATVVTWSATGPTSCN